MGRSVGSAARLYLVAIVLQYLLFDAWGIPFVVTVVIMLFLLRSGLAGKLSARALKLAGGRRWLQSILAAIALFGAAGSRLADIARFIIERRY